MELGESDFEDPAHALNGFIGLRKIAILPQKFDRSSDLGYGYIELKSWLNPLWSRFKPREGRHFTNRDVVPVGQILVGLEFFGVGFFIRTKPFHFLESIESHGLGVGSAESHESFEVRALLSGEP